MEQLSKILSKYSVFIIIFIIVLAIIFVLSICFNKKKIKKSIYLYGMFVDYKTNQIWALVCFISQFLLLVFSLVTKQALNVPISLICLLLVFIGAVLSGDLLNMLINTIICGVNLLVLYYGGLVDVLRDQTGDSNYLLLQIAIMFAGLLLYVFTLLKFVNDIRKKDRLNVKS